MCPVEALVKAVLVCRGVGGSKMRVGQRVGIIKGDQGLGELRMASGVIWIACCYPY